MKQKVLLIGVVLTLLLVSYPVVAIVLDPINDGANGSKPSIIIEYGKGKEAGLVKVTHIHYVKSVDKARPSKTVTCYKLAGWKWTKLPITYTVNSYNDDGLTSNFVEQAIQNADSAWDGNTATSLFAYPPAKGAYLWSTYDGKNSISFGNYGSSGVIAVTATWYSRFTKTAVESDILFDTDFTWGDASTDSTKMDLQNIATHEIGHTLGLSDLYTTSCSPVTMYGYSGYGDVGKRSLEIPDITGLQNLYGP